ncbi:protein phosphatase [Massilia sp. PAMC28688]|uniref:PP2C family protein-serine/threonine phosphatase n=1 Tax=Massilia sp. PAMC28688 TaxID=2861283 RepID=UPI001C6362FE|nr:protein phosphatase [Massilia sp. PAMC28688]QYF93362.1 protein phosphatase [Massilia sp. PAMC28688]
MTSPILHQHFAPHFDIAAWSAAGAQAGILTENQDNFLLIDTAGSASFLREQRVCAAPVTNWPQGHIRVAVLDGMGGHGFGREAAQAVVQGLLDIPACTSVGALSHHLDHLHGRLQAQFGKYTSPSQRPGTTLTLLEIPPGQPALLYHVGDSRLYQLRPGMAPQPLTIDHVPATVHAMDGALDDMDWWQQVHGEHRSQIAQAFILGHAFGHTGQINDPLFALAPGNLPAFLAHLPDRRVLALDPDSVYLLASDGFWACPSPQLWLARWPALLARHGSAAAMCHALFEAMETAPPPDLHPDNLTAIVLRPLRAHEVTALPSATGAH